jgi:DNA-binding CsgD family transcriptional regulator
VANRVARHLGRVIKLRLKLDMERNITSGLRNSLELVAFGIVIVDLHGKVLMGNRSADAILRTGDGLKCHRGRLICEQARDASALQDAIRSVAQPLSGPPQVATDFRVTRRVSRSPLTVHVVPIPSTSAWKGFVPPLGVAAVFIVDPLCGAADVDGFADAYGLTASEGRVLREIGRGGGLIDAAAKLGVAVPTARTQLQHIFEKTNSNSQAELVRLVMMSPLQSRSKI